MGNPLLKNYNIEKDHFLTGGFNNLWKIFKGSRKDRKQDVCIFVLEKKSLDKYPKEEREEILSSLKKEAGALVKFKHPSMLGIYEQVMEDKQTLIFVTEPVQYTLNSWVETSGASKLEIKLMITEICHVLNFLHDDAHVIHGSLNPENIFIDTQGHIKLSGLGFSLSDPSINGIECRLNFSTPNSIPNLSYVAPEIVNDQMANYQSDIYSIGIIVFNILKRYKNEDRDKELLCLNGNNSVSSYNRAYESVAKILLKLSFEGDDNDLIRKALIGGMQNRPRIKDFLEHTWFNDPKLKALRFIENLENNDASKNNEFLNKFPQILSFFEPKIIDRRFLPALMNALRVETLIVAALPAIFCISESPNMKIDFEQAVWPGLKHLFQMKQLPAAGLFYILSKLNFLSEKISNSEFASNMLNIICKALDCNVPKIQSVVMDNLSFVIKKVDSLAFKNQIYPRLINVLLNTSSHSLKILVLKSFTTIYSLLDHAIINDSLLVNLEKVRKSENSAEVCMCLANIYEEIAKIVSIESIANKILPNLISILLSGNISKSNYEFIMVLVQKYLTRIKETREKDLTDDTGLSNSKIDGKDSSSLITITSTKGGNEKDDFSFLNSFFGINSSASGNPGNSIPPTSGNTFTSDTKNNFDYDFASTQITHSANDVAPTNPNSGFKKMSFMSDANTDSNPKHKSHKSLIEKESKAQINKNDNNNILDSLGFSQFSVSENKPSNTKPANNLNRNNIDNFNFNTQNNLHGAKAQHNSGNNTFNMNFNKKPAQEEIKGYNFTKQSETNNKANILDSLLNNLEPVGNQSSNSDWNGSIKTGNSTEVNINYNHGMNNKNKISSINNMDGLGFDFDFTGSNNSNFPQNTQQNQKDTTNNPYDFNFGGSSDSLSKNNNISNSNNNLMKNTPKTNAFQNDPFAGLNLTPNNKTSDPTKNLLDGLLKF